MKDSIGVLCINRVFRSLLEVHTVEIINGQPKFAGYPFPYVGLTPRWGVDTSIEQVPPATGRCGAFWWTHAQSRAGSERTFLVISKVCTRRYRAWKT